MSEPGVQSLGHGRRWLAVGVVLAAVVIAGIKLATRNGAPKNVSVSLVPPHATVREKPKSWFAVRVVNKSKSWVHISWIDTTPRTSGSFRFPGDTGITLDIPNRLVAPHSEKRFSTRAFPVSPTGNYWVWTVYQYVRPIGHGQSVPTTANEKVHVTSTALTVLAP